MAKKGGSCYRGQVQNKPLRLRFGRTGRSELDEESFVET